MARKRGSKKKQKNNNAQKGIIAVILLLIVAGVGIFGGAEIGDLFGITIQKPPTPTPPATLIADEHAFSVHIIDCGQADAILLSKDASYALVDAGETMSPSQKEARDKIIAYLDSLGVKKLEFVLFTHQDYDHIGSGLDILKKYSVKRVYDNGVAHTSATYEKLMQHILDENIRYDIVKAGDKISSPWSGVSIDVLSPPGDLIMSGSSPDINENSVVLKVTYGDISYLLTGDAGKDAEEYILSTGYNTAADILKAGHHGSRHSSTKDFLNKVSPDVIVVSVGEGNSYGHPHKEALERFAKVTNLIYRTDLDGDVVVATDGSKYSVVTGNGAYSLEKELVSGNGEAVFA